MNIDPLTENYERFSPYTFVANNPIRYYDPDGMRFDDVNERKAQKIERKIQKKQQRNNKKIERANRKIAKKRNKISQIQNGPNNAKAQAKVGRLQKQIDNLNNKAAEINTQNDFLDLALDDIDVLRDDPNHNYIFAGATQSGVHGVLLTENGIVIQGANSALHIHEVRHVVQAKDGRGLRFGTGPRTLNMLLNDGTTIEQVRANEVEAYQVQFSFDGSYPAPGGASKLGDINEDSLLTITNSKGNRVYR